MTSKLGTYKCGAGPAMGVGGQRASCASQPLRMQLPALSLFWLLTSGAPAAVAGGLVFSGIGKIADQNGKTRGVCCTLTQWWVVNSSIDQVPPKRPSPDCLTPP